MSRHAVSKSLAELAKLTQVREMAALEHVSRTARLVAAVDAKIDILSNRRSTAETLVDAALAEKWWVWRIQELTRLNQRKAKLIVDHREAMAEYGRVTAENAVLRKLGKRAEAEEAQSARSQSSYIS